MTSQTLVAEKKKIGALIPASFVGLNVAITASLLNLTSLDLFLRITVSCFAISTPILAVVALHAYSNANEGISKMAAVFLLYFGMLVSFLGLAFTIAHFYWEAGLVFLVFTFVSVFIYFFVLL